MNPTLEQDLRYPIGRYERVTTSLGPAERTAYISDIAAAPSLVRSALDGLDGEQLDEPYRPGGWTVRQVVHHLADSHLNSYVRFKLALTEDEPTVKPYDEKAWAELTDSRMDPETSVVLLDMLHRRWVALLEDLTVEQWARRFAHPERGPMNLDETLALYAWHGKHHVAHITRLRERKGW